MRLPLLCLLVASFLVAPLRAEPFFKKNDVIALVGGEDMVVASECGYLELLLTRALPDYHLRFRSLAWEGDTVYEQRRDLNFPTWEEQLDKIGATVVVCQFGQMESLDGPDKMADFVTAYSKLLARLSGDGKRRMVLVSPNYFSDSISTASTENPSDVPKPRVLSLQQRANLKAYADAIQAMAEEKPAKGENVSVFVSRGNWKYPQDVLYLRDGIHLNSFGHASGLNQFLKLLAEIPSGKWVGSPDNPYRINFLDASSAGESRSSENALLSAIRSKNKLWFNYWRVQNWAFLFGDRTNQPSSRDWRDPSKRWFPAEREEFLPLIESREKEIDALAERLSAK